MADIHQYLEYRQDTNAKQETAALKAVVWQNIQVM